MAKNAPMVGSPSLSKARADEGKALLLHYFRMMLERSGGEWDPDFETEIGVAVDCIIEAAEERVLERLSEILRALSNKSPSDGSHTS